MVLLVILNVKLIIVIIKLNFEDNATVVVEHNMRATN
jgi:hypothetical protein